MFCSINDCISRGSISCLTNLAEVNSMCVYVCFFVCQLTHYACKALSQNGKVLRHPSVCVCMSVCVQMFIGMLRVSGEQPSTGARCLNRSASLCFGSTLTDVSSVSPVTEPSTACLYAFACLLLGKHSSARDYVCLICNEFKCRCSAGFHDLHTSPR